MKVAKVERKTNIVAYLQEKQFVEVNRIVEHFGYSLSTVKRDLAELDDEGLIRRTHGGAMPIDQEKVDVSYLMKLSSHVDDTEKNEVALKAGLYIKNDMTLFLDSSTTSLRMIPIIAKHEGLLVITNSVLTASMLSEYTNADVIILGGKVTRKKFTVHSLTTLEQLKRYCVDLAIISCRGFDEVQGATENSEGEATIKRTLKEMSKKILLLVTPDKMNRKHLYQALLPDDAIIIS